MYQQFFTSSLIKPLTILLLVSLSLVTFSANAGPTLDQKWFEQHHTSHANTEGVATLGGKQLQIDRSKTTHWIFINLWDIYEGNGTDTVLANLPTEFLESSQAVWVQPEINVTRAQLKEFQQYYPNVTPLVFDTSNKIAHSKQVWQSPFHILEKNGKQVFTGNTAALNAYLGIANGSDAQSNSAGISKLNTHDVNRPYSYPTPGKRAPDFEAIDLTGKTLSLEHILAKRTDKGNISLIFLDSLCPMPHFPNCEAKMAQIAQLTRLHKNRQWIGIASSFYVDANVVKTFADTHGFHFPILFDEGNRIHASYGVNSSPYRIDLDAGGLIHSRGSKF